MRRRYFFSSMTALRHYSAIAFTTAAYFFLVADAASVSSITR
jgi:hypothetical protein